MANVETEQNNTPVPQQEGADASASINLHEENLEALLSALSSAGTVAGVGREPAKPTAPVVAPVLVSPEISAAKGEEPGAPDPVVPASVVSTSVVSTSVVSTVQSAEAKVMEPAPQEASVVSGNTAPVPVAVTSSPQQDTNSKLALLSSIKQRRAINVRPEPSEATAPAAEPTSKIPVEEPAPSKVIDPAAGATQVPVVEAKAIPSVTSPVSPTHVPRTEIKPTLTAKKNWNGPAGTPAPENRGEYTKVDVAPLPQKQKQGPEEGLKLEVPKPTPPKPAAAVSAYEPVPTAFSALKTASADEGEDKSKSFLTSKAGMGVIGGAVLAGAVAAFLLTGHSSKPSSAAKPSGTESVQAAPAPTVIPPVTGDTANPTSNAANNTAANSQFPKPGTPQALALQQQQAAQQKPVVAPAVSPVAVPQPAPVTETPKPAARAFSLPTPIARPVSATITDAPPTISASTAAPVAVGMPARIAPLPAPNAPAPPPASSPTASSAAGQPTQITVAGKTQAARLVRQIVPVYPSVAKTARVQGTVRFRVTIGADGQVKSVNPLGGPLPLVQSAADAVKQWRYQPTIVDGKPVEVVTEVDVQFAL